MQFAAGAAENSEVFWLGMTVVTSLVAVLYLVVGTGRLPLRLSAERRAKFHSSGVLAVGWTCVCYGHYLLRHRSSR